MTIPIPAPNTVERRRKIPSALIRRRALERLYERRAAVEDLIASLERYERANGPCSGACVQFTSFSRKYPLGCAQ